MSINLKSHQSDKDKLKRYIYAKSFAEGLDFELRSIIKLQHFFHFKNTICLFYYRNFQLWKLSDISLSKDFFSKLLFYCDSTTKSFEKCNI